MTAPVVKSRQPDSGALTQATSVVRRKQHGGDRAVTLTAQVFRDHPDGAVLLGVVAGEQATFRLAVVGIVGGLVFAIEIAPVACCKAIEQADDHVLRHGSRDSGSGDAAAKGMAHGWGGTEGGRLCGRRPEQLLGVWSDQACWSAAAPFVRWCCTSCLTVGDMACRKLLANSDQWNDDSVFSRDILDLAHLPRKRDSLAAAISKSEAAYGTSIRVDVNKAVDKLKRQQGWLERCQTMLCLESPRAVLWQKPKHLERLVASC